MPLVAGLTALASLQSSLFPRRVAFVWSLFALLLAGYAALITWGPSVTTADGLRAQVIAQKAATMLVVLTLVYMAREADRARAIHTGASADAQLRSVDARVIASLKSARSSATDA